MKAIKRNEAVGVVFLGALLIVGCGEKKMKPVSPEAEASGAALRAIIDKPFRNGIGISKRSIVEGLSINSPFKTTDEAPVLGFPHLVAVNERAVIEVQINGPEENLWSLGIRATLETGRIDLGQESHRLLAATISKIDPVAWVWVTDQIRQSSERDFEVLRVQKTFGSRHLSLWINPPAATAPASFSILILSAS